MARTALLFGIFAIAAILGAPHALAKKGADGDQVALRECLSKWASHPFPKDGDLTFKKIGANVKVMGIGDDVADTAKTDQPELVLVKPSVSVMTKATYRLMNPNGWYCMKAKVSVMAKSVIEVDCSAHLAATNEGITIAASNESSKEIAVLGKATVQKKNCKS